MNEMTSIIQNPIHRPQQWSSSRSLLSCLRWSPGPCRIQRPEFPFLLSSSLSLLFRLQWQSGCHIWDNIHQLHQSHYIHRTHFKHEILHILSKHKMTFLTTECLFMNSKSSSEQLIEIYHCVGLLQRMLALFFMTLSTIEPFSTAWSLNRNLSFHYPLNIGINSHTCAFKTCLHILFVQNSILFYKNRE